MYVCIIFLSIIEFLFCTEYCWNDHSFTLTINCVNICVHIYRHMHMSMKTFKFDSREMHVKYNSLAVKKYPQPMLKKRKRLKGE